MNGPPQITVAVVSWNTRALLRRCLASLQPEAGRCEVWVVDNASADGSAELVRSEFPWVRLIASEENLGFGRAVNLVAAQTTTPWLVLANADVAPRAAALDALLAAADADRAAGAVAPRLVLPDGSTQHSVFSFPTLGQALVISSGIGSLVPALADRFLLLGRTDLERPRVVPWAVAALLLVRRAAWDAVGGFDERHWMYAEDLDLGWRLARAGWTTRYEPRALADHASAAATEQAWRGGEKVERWQRETYAWMRRRLGRGRTLGFALLQASGQAARWLLFTSLARVAPRFAHRRDSARWWLRLHLAAFRPVDWARVPQRCE
jgi:N-acetylglucosaminyl-diphospho-decaprenol L-rhamnosyltransferase